MQLPWPTVEMAVDSGVRAVAVGQIALGRTSKLHGLTDAHAKPRLIMLSADINDMTMAGSLIKAATGRFDRLIAKRAYDTGAIRAAIAAQAPRSSSR